MGHLVVLLQETLNLIFTLYMRVCNSIVININLYRHSTENVECVKKNSPFLNSFNISVLYFLDRRFNVKVTVHRFRIVGTRNRLKLSSRPIAQLLLLVDHFGPILHTIKSTYVRTWCSIEIVALFSIHSEMLDIISNILSEPEVSANFS